jgi:homoserine O-acetyltransferase
MIPGAQYRPIPSIWGHQAGGGLNPVDNKFVDDALKELLAS